MTAKVIIENGFTRIELFPENEFETDIIEKVEAKKKTYNIEADTYVHHNYGIYTKHQLTISISKRTENPQNK